MRCDEGERYKILAEKHCSDDSDIARETMDTLYICRYLYMYATVSRQARLL